MMYNNPLSQLADEKHFDQIKMLNETFLSHDAVLADALSVQVNLDKGASAEFQQKSGGSVVIKADQTPAGPMARVIVKDGSVSWRKVNVHICMKDGSRLMQTVEL